MDSGQGPNSSDDSSAYQGQFAEWAQMTGWHGMLDFLYAKTLILKCVWGVVIGMGCFLAVSQSYSLLIDFSEEDRWVTSVTYESPDTDDGVLDWPNFTICNLNWLAKSKLNATGLTGRPYAIEYAANQNKGIEFYQTMLDPDMQVEDTDYQSFIMNTNGDDLNAIMGRLAQTCNDTLLVCGQSKEFDLRNSSRNCCAQSRPSSGYSCFKINPSIVFPKRSQFDAAGYQAGIYFILDARPTDDYENIIYLERPSAGFKITLYYGEDDTDPLNPALFLAPAQHSVISVAASKTRTRPRSRQGGVSFADVTVPCRSVAEYRYVKSEIYTSALCQIDCNTRYMMDECNCTTQIGNFKNISQCRAEQFECSRIYTELNNSSFQQSRLSLRGFNLSECVRSCREPCEYVSAEAKISSAHFPSPKKTQAFTEYINRALGQNYTIEITEQLTLLEIFYELNQYKVVERTERISLDELISNVGGTLGVWTGISIISIFQALLYFVFGLRSLIARCSQRRQPQPQAIPDFHMPPR